MRRLVGLLAVAAVLTLAVPASADVAGTWVDKSTAWSSLGSNGGLVANGNDLYYFRGQSASKYDWSTDTWTSQASSSNTGYIIGRDPFSYVYNVNGQFYFYHHTATDYVEIFNPSGAGSWSTVIMPTDDSIDTGHLYTKSWSQGCVYNSYDEKYYTMWTDVPNGGGFPGGMCYSAYDPDTGNWTAISGFTWIGPGWSWWSATQTVTVGTNDYKLSSNPQSNVVTLSWYDLTRSDIPSGDSSGTTSSYTLSSNLATGEMWACITLAVWGTDIYVAGGGTSGHFLRYDTVNDEWMELGSFAATSDGDSACNHSIAVANDYVIVQDGSQFLMYLIPEPATVGLLALGGVGLVAIRRRR